MYFELTDHFVVRASMAETWAFFGTATNLPRITPGWLGFTILTPEPVTIAKDSIFDYTIRWAGVPVRWRTQIIDWSPPHQFIDLQVRGPYTLWHHQHTYCPHERGTECTDRVIYKLPMGVLGRATHALFVKRQLMEIFRHRRSVIGQSLGWEAAVQEDVRVARLG